MLISRWDLQLEIFDHLGREVQVLLNEVQLPGYHEATFNANDMASGIYFYRLRAGSYIDMKKMILIK